VAATGENQWPLPGSPVTVYGEDLMAADTVSEQQALVVRTAGQEVDCRRDLLGLARVPSSMASPSGR
jgi:hypothetical protein